MTLVGRPRLAEFGRRHATARDVLAAWAAEVEAAAWSSPSEIKARYRTASFVGNDRVVFNLKGNHFRLDAQINYSAQVVLVQRIGTHSEYEKWTF